MGLPSEARAIIYKHYFGDGTIIRYTRAADQPRARVYYKSKVGLMVICKAVYLEAHPLYWSSATLILKNTRLDNINSTDGFSPLQFVERIQLVDDWYDALDVAQLPALKTLKLSITGHWRDHVRLPHANSSDEAIGYVEGEVDDNFKAQAKQSIFAAKT